MILQSPLDENPSFPLFLNSRFTHRQAVFDLVDPDSNDRRPQNDSTPAYAVVQRRYGSSTRFYLHIENNCFKHHRGSYRVAWPTTLLWGSVWEKDKRGEKGGGKLKVRLCKLPDADSSYRAIRGDGRRASEVARCLRARRGPGTISRPSIFFESRFHFLLPTAFPHFLHVRPRPGLANRLAGQLQGRQGRSPRQIRFGCRSLFCCSNAPHASQEGRTPRYLPGGNARRRFQSRRRASGR